MDGVLIDSHPAHGLAWRRFLATIGRNVDDQHLEYILEGRRRDEILRHFLGDLSQERLAEYGRQKDLFFQESFQDVQLSRGVGQFLDALMNAGLKIGMATSASSRRTRNTLDLLDLRRKFFTVVTGDDVPHGKPDPAVYRLASQRMNVSPENLLALEDAPCGVQAAKNAGIRCIGVSSNGHAESLSKAGADRVIRDFCGLSVESLLHLWHNITEPQVCGLEQA